MDNWQQCTQSGRGIISSRYPMNLPLGLKHERFDEDLMAWASDYRFSENNIRRFYNRWSELIDAES